MYVYITNSNITKNTIRLKVCDTATLVLKSRGNRLRSFICPRRVHVCSGLAAKGGEKKLHASYQRKAAGHVYIKEETTRTRQPEHYGLHRRLCDLGAIWTKEVHQLLQTYKEI